MKEKKRWSPPGWPWELELLALIFVITAIAVPYYLSLQTTETSEVSLLARAEAARRQEVSTWTDFQGFFWSVAIVGIYIVHLAMGGASIQLISTPFMHLFSPLIFSAITYYRLYCLTKGSSLTTTIVSGSTLEIVLWTIGVLAITFMVARIRMARHMLNFRDIEWDISTPTLFDTTYFGLLAHFRPLVYPPRAYRACKDGILIEGWFYVMPIPFASIHAIDMIRSSSIMQQGYYLATSSRSLMRLQISESTEPIYISPKERTRLFVYCEQILAARGITTLKAKDTKSGTTGGFKKTTRYVSPPTVK